MQVGLVDMCQVLIKSTNDKSTISSRQIYPNKLFILYYVKIICVKTNSILIFIHKEQLRLSIDELQPHKLEWNREHYLGSQPNSTEPDGEVAVCKTV